MVKRGNLLNSAVERIRPGEVFEQAIWMDGRETKQQVQACIIDMNTAFHRLAEMNNVIIAEPAFDVKYPGEDRVPTVPLHIAGPNVRLLVGEARIVSFRPQASPAGGFVQQLDAIDRERLRIITRRAHQNHNPSSARLSDAECDAIAEQVGPESAASAIRRAVDSKAIH